MFGANRGATSLNCGAVASSSSTVARSASSMQRIVWKASSSLPHVPSGWRWK